MKRLSLCILVALALLVTSAAIAQAGAPQGSQGSSPSMGQSGPGGQQPGSLSGQAGTPSTMPSQTDQNTAGQAQPEKSEKKLKGCVQSEGGQTVLQTKKGSVSLTGQDVSAHAGHEVSVKGMWESGGGASSSAASSGSSGKTFNVSSVKMISDSCGEKIGSSGSMGTSSPSGTGSQPATGTQPPQ